MVELYIYPHLKYIFLSFDGGRYISKSYRNRSVYLSYRLMVDFYISLRVFLDLCTVFRVIVYIIKHISDICTHLSFLIDLYTPLHRKHRDSS